MLETFLSMSNMNKYNIINWTVYIYTHIIYLPIYIYIYALQFKQKGEEKESHFSMKPFIREFRR